MHPHHPQHPAAFPSMLSSTIPSISPPHPTSHLSFFHVRDEHPTLRTVAGGMSPNSPCWLWVKSKPGRVTPQAGSVQPPTPSSEPLSGARCCTGVTVTPSWMTTLLFWGLHYIPHTTLNTCRISQHTQPRLLHHPTIQQSILIHPTSQGASHSLTLPNPASFHIPPPNPASCTIPPHNSTSHPSASCQPLQPC